MLLHANMNVCPPCHRDRASAAGLLREARSSASGASAHVAFVGSRSSSSVNQRQLRRRRDHAPASLSGIATAASKEAAAAAAAAAAARRSLSQQRGEADETCCDGDQYAPTVTSLLLTDVRNVGRDHLGGVQMCMGPRTTVVHSLSTRLYY